MKTSWLPACLFAACLVGAWGGLSPVKAAPLDFQATTCKDFLTRPKEEMDAAIAWVDGFYMDEDASTVIDFDKLKTNAGKLNTYCTSHPDVILGAAAEELFGK